MTGNSRRQVGHHSAQKTMYTGFCSAERVKSVPSASARLKSGARGPSTTTGAVVAAVLVGPVVPGTSLTCGTSVVDDEVLDGGTVSKVSSVICPLPQAVAVTATTARAGRNLNTIVTLTSSAP